MPSLKPGGARPANYQSVVGRHGGELQRLRCGQCLRPSSTSRSTFSVVLSMPVGRRHRPQHHSVPMAQREHFVQTFKKRGMRVVAKQPERCKGPDQAW
jgi:hypothetical protein